MIAVDNLADIIRHCIDSPDVIGETLLVSDGEDLTTTQLVEIIASRMGKTGRLFAIPDRLALMMAGLTGKRSVYERLWGSLVIDSSKMRRLLHWQPVVSATEGIEKTVDWYLKSS